MFMARGRAVRAEPRPGRLSRRRAAAGGRLAHHRSNCPPPGTEARHLGVGVGVEEVVTENNPGLGSVWPRDRAPQRRWGGVRSQGGEN